ncbi:hypothetical protein LLH00_02140 [bacterium]|nr:hypothetical protein [bacterium]
MTRLQKFALYRMVYSLVWFAFGLFYLQLMHRVGWFMLLLGLSFIVLLIIKRYQKRHYPGLGVRLDELETLVELKTYKLVSQGIFWYVALGGLALIVFAANTKSETISIITFFFFILGLIPVQELLHLIGVRYYTVNEDALKKPEVLVR